MCVLSGALSRPVTVISQHMFSSTSNKLEFLYHMFFKESLNNLYL